MENLLAMELKCNFENLGWSVGGLDQTTQLYTCVVNAAEIGQPGTVIRAFNGTHHAGKSNMDVEALQFFGCKFKHFPRGVQNMFPNLRLLHVSNCGLTTIARSDFDGLQSLEALYIRDRTLKSLPSNLFLGMSKLKIISLFDSQIDTMSSDILKPVMNNDLMGVSFGNNGNLDAFFHPGQRGSTTSIKALMKIIDEKCKRPTNDNLIAPAQRDLKDKAKDAFMTAVSDLWESKKFADFTINFGSKQFRVHKFVLTTQSSKFAEMFEEQEVHEMNISDLDEAVVDAFLRFFYTGEVPNDVNFIQLFKLSSKLDVAVLTTYCKGIILSNLQESNAYEIFKLGHSHGNEEFKKQAFERILQMFSGTSLPERLMENPEALKELIDAKQLLNSVIEKIKNL